MVTYVRRFLYDKNLLKRRGVETATINIGNLAVGGTGKTPHCQYVINLLKPNFNIAFLSRGYKRESRGFVSTNNSSTKISAQTIGDEPFMISNNNPDIVVGVDKDRFHGAQQLLSKNNNLDAIILDDAYQHLDFECGLHILLTEFENPYFRDLPLPSGRLREWASAAKYADVVIVTKTPENQTINIGLWRKKLKLRDNQHLFFSQIVYNQLLPASDAAKETIVNKSTSVVLLTGIAHPKPLLDHLKNKYNVVKHFNYPDHHNYSVSEIENIAQSVSKFGENTILVTTEKDWARIRPNKETNIISLLPIFVETISADFINTEQKNNFNNIVLEYVRRKKTKNSTNG